MQKNYDHSLYQLLVKLGIVSPEHIVPYAPRVRDRDDIEVFQCSQSGVIFLGRIDQSEQQYYAGKDTDSGTFDIGEEKLSYCELDNNRYRKATYGHFIKGKRWLDFGCGTGALVEDLGPHCEQAWGIEINDMHLARARKLGRNVVKYFDELPVQGFDVITMFHVFEHLPNPVETIQKLQGFLCDGGMLLVEVPHAKDFLLHTLDSEAFRRFTLWSEHLVLHTSESLKALLGAAGFENIEVEGYQRFPVSNHLYWLRHGEPGGHDEWAFLNTAELHQAYSGILKQIGQTDTIVAVAKR